MAMTTSAAACTYHLDEEFRIVSVDSAWSEFAIANGAPELLPPAPIGRSVWSYISDSTTAQLYLQIFESVRRKGVPLVFPIRCDSPALRRRLDLRVGRATQGGFEVSSAVIEISERPALRLLERQATRDPDTMLLMCSWCKNVQTGHGWRPAEEATVLLGLFERATLPEITHGMCPACEETINATLTDPRR
jgi:hypothetical protein